MRTSHTVPIEFCRNDLQGPAAVTSGHPGAGEKADGRNVRGLGPRS